ncbi:hypothetical protein FUAX_52980 (plasmid) [Fulvitalea axinellae]|uniref:Lipocalin-like domain-containing protein n=1 Tax=Fulvitalea axinellae TaxID=1182444 RepID=A0AAU9DIB3_9BACT|nr:hypothetical protein FUAX_52980 [Fulvitalea axinellae]
MQSINSALICIAISLIMLGCKPRWTHLEGSWSIQFAIINGKKVSKWDLPISCHYFFLNKDLTCVFPVLLDKHEMENTRHMCESTWRMFRKDGIMYLEIKSSDDEVFHGVYEITHYGRFRKKNHTGVAVPTVGMRLQTIIDKQDTVIFDCVKNIISI